MLAWMPLGCRLLPACQTSEVDSSSKRVIHQQSVRRLGYSNRDTTMVKHWLEFQNIMKKHLELCVPLVCRLLGDEVLELKLNTMHATAA